MNLNAKKSFIESSGDIIQIALPASAFISTFTIKDSTNRTSQLIKTVGSTFIITHSLKRIINKARPENNGDYSFPSGHTSSAFSGAVFIQRIYGYKYGIPAVLLASFVGFSRIEGESDKHDIWDVLGGAAIGSLNAVIFTKSKAKNYDLGIYYGKESYVLCVRLSF
jgi:hypothetical protein